MSLGGRLQLDAPAAFNQSPLRAGLAPAGHGGGAAAADGFVGYLQVRAATRNGLNRGARNTEGIHSVFGATVMFY